MLRSCHCWNVALRPSQLCRFQIRLQGRFWRLQDFLGQRYQHDFLTKSESEYISATPGERCSFYNAPAFVLGDKLFFDRGSMEGLLMSGWDPALPAVELSDGTMKLHVSHYESHRRETIVVEVGRLNLGLHH